MDDDHTKETKDLEFRPEEDFGENPDEFVPPMMPEYEMTDDGLPEGEEFGEAKPKAEAKEEKVSEKVAEPEPEKEMQEPVIRRAPEVSHIEIEETVVEEKVAESEPEPEPEPEPVKEPEPEPVKPAAKEEPKANEISDREKAQQILAADRATHMDTKTKRTGLKLLWITILAIVLLGAAGFGIWRYTESLKKEQAKPATPSSTPQTEEVVVKIEDALEVNLEEIDLSKYDSNIVITEPGDFTLTGNFKHTVFVNSDADTVMLILDNVNIESEVAIVNVREHTILTVQSKEGSKNSLISTKEAKNYPAVVWSKAAVNFTGKGYTEIIAPEVNKDENVTAETAPTAIVSESAVYFKDGQYFTEGHIRAKDYYVNGGVLVAVAYKNIAAPSKESTQGYVPKNFLNVYSGKLSTTMNSEEGGKLVTFATDHTFSSLIVSKEDVVNEREYAFSFTEDADVARGILYPTL